jgi:hypothetical protein
MWAGVSINPLSSGTSDHEELYFADSENVPVVDALKKIVKGMSLVAAAIKRGDAVYIYCHAGAVRSVTAVVCLFHLFGLSFSSSFVLLLTNGRTCQRLLGYKDAGPAANFIAVSEVVSSAVNVELNHNPNPGRKRR